MKIIDVVFSWSRKKYLLFRCRCNHTRKKKYKTVFSFHADKKRKAILNQLHGMLPGEVFQVNFRLLAGQIYIAA